MPFDAAGWPPEAPKPKRQPPGDNAVTALIVILAFVLLVMPLSLAGFADLVRYMRMH